MQYEIKTLENIKYLKLNPEQMDMNNIDYKALFNALASAYHITGEPRLLYNNKHKALSDDGSIKDYIAIYEQGNGEKAVFANFGCSFFAFSEISNVTAEESLQLCKAIIDEKIAKAQPLLVKAHAKNCYQKLQDIKAILQELETA